MLKKSTLYIFLLFSSGLFSQKYNFVNWTVEDGLIQSQASYICQDNFRQLWIGTEGGISRFDGKKFTAFTVQDGLIDNHINTMLCDKQGNMWIGTNYGLSFYNGRNFKSIKPFQTTLNNILQIVQTANGSIYATDNFKLTDVTEFRNKKIVVSGDTSEKITCIDLSKTGDLLVWVYKKGLYALKGNTFLPLSHLEEDQKAYFIRTIYITSKNDTLLGTNSGLFHLVAKHLVPFPLMQGLYPDLNILCLAEDSKQHVWAGTDNGVYKVETDKILHFNEKSGFTDNSVNHIYKDVENNLWFATNAEGIYKFRENTFTYYDKSSGLSNTIVTGVTQTKNGTIYTAGYGGGLYKINSKNDIESVNFKGPVLVDSKINCLYADDENNVWIGTLNKGAYVFNEKTGLQKIVSPNNPELTVQGTIAFLKDLQGNMLIGTNRGLFLKNKDNTITLIKGRSPIITALKQFDENHVLLGTAKGLYLLDQNYHLKPFYDSIFGNSSVLCLSKNKNTIWIGTTDKGVLNFNYKTKKTITYTLADGLPSNFIYSIDVSDTRKAWIGTGFGISNLQLNDSGKVVAIKNYGRSDGLLGMECNHNCLLKAKDSSLWFGTTKGLFHFNPYTNIVEKNQALVLLRSVKLFSSEIRDSSLFKNPGAWFNVPQGLQLSSKQNHLTFELGSIYFTNPDDVFYKYKLDGIDKTYATTLNPWIIYPSLPPGKYTLKVAGITKSGSRSINEINYSFEIKKAFYQTRFFQVVVILLLLGTGALLAYISTRGKQKRKQKAKELLEKIREEEFDKLRQRTAEDFHDEMGNSLTRISVLTDILKSKLNGSEKEITKLVQQIKENTSALYSGSKDIIWSLNSQNDGLYETVEHIRDIGNELFQETQVELKYRHSINPTKNLKLKLDYSRNLTMIFKEVYSNILKHARANEVIVSLNLNSSDDLEIEISDNGEGFNVAEIQQGNGIKNMKNRVLRMNGEMKQDSVLRKGTQIKILLKNIFIN